MTKCRTVISMVTRYQWQTQEQKPKSLPLLYRGKYDIAEEYQSSEKHVVWKQVRNSRSLSGGRFISHLNNALQMLICQFAKQSLKEGLVQVCAVWRDSWDGESALDVPVKSAADEIRTKLYFIPGTYCSRWDNSAFCEDRKALWDCEALSSQLPPTQRLSIPGPHSLWALGIWQRSRGWVPQPDSIWKWIQIHSLEGICLFSPQATQLWVRAVMPVAFTPGPSRHWGSHCKCAGSTGVTLMFHQTLASPVVTVFKGGRARFDLQDIVGLHGCQSGKAWSVPLWNSCVWCSNHCKVLKIAVIRLVHGMGKQFHFK